MIGAAVAMAMAVTPAGSWQDHYIKAGEMMKAGRRDNAAVQFYVGQIRARTQLRCVKQVPQAGPAAFASLQEVVGRPINEYLGSSPDKWIAAIDAAMKWDLANPDPQNRSGVCVAEKARQRQGLMELRRTIDSRREWIREERRKNGLPNE